MDTSSDKRIVAIGAGSASFGRGTIADIMASRELRDAKCTVALMDTDKESLHKTARLAERIRDHHHSPVRIEESTDIRQALEGADFAIISVAQKRYELWEQDFRIPLAYGFHHVLGENGGPGALFHTLRNYRIVLPICREIEETCPNALVLNYTNPESRIIMAMSRLTKVRAVGLCHGVLGTRQRIAELLGRNLADLDIVIGGLNHFFWVLRVRDVRTGKDLYPLLRRRARRSTPPLAAKMMQVFGYYTFPSDDHIGEYLSFAHDFARPLWPYGRESSAVPRLELPRPDWRDAYLSGERPVDDNLVRPSGEIAIRIIEDIVKNTGRWEPAVNVPNSGGYVENLPSDAVVEVPAVVDAEGVHPRCVGPLPEALASLCRTQVSIQKLIVEAYRTGSKNLLLQALLLDPVVDSAERAERMLDHMLKLQKDYLPSFT